MDDHGNNLTWVWRYFEAGRNYNNSLTPNQYTLVDTNWEFYTGNQWIRLPQTKAMSKLSKPVFNIIKRITQLFIASLTSNATTVSFEPLAYYDGTNLKDPEKDASVYANAEVRNLFEKFKMDYRIRDALIDGAVTGDYCAHFYWDPTAMPYGGALGPYKGEIKMELVDGINVMFGNPNVSDAQEQPYIILVGRETVQNLNHERKFYEKKKNKGDGVNGADEVTPDAEVEEMSAIGGKTEIEPDDKTGKALVLYFYTKVCHDEDEIDPETNEPKYEDELDEEGNPIQLKDKKGKPMFNSMGEPINKRVKVTKHVTTVYVTKATRNCIIYEDVDTGLSLYPIAWGNWEKQKNQYHGRALVTGITPNQTFLNRAFAMMMRHMQNLGFPKMVYNADLIREWSNEVGETIGVHGLQPGQQVQSVAMSMAPADMSNQLITLLDKTMAYTKECLGATDAQMGNIKPDNTSAMMVLQSASEVPLENVRAAKNEWVEDIAAVLLDMMGTYYGNRPIVVEKSFDEPVLGPDGAPVIDPNTGMMKMNSVKRKAVEEFDFSQFKHLWLSIGVNAGATTYFSEIAMVQTLDNLHKDGALDTIEYLERLPDKLLPRKAELIDKMRQAAGVPDPNAIPTNSPPPQSGAPAAAGASNPLAASNVPVPTKPQAGKGGAPKGVKGQPALPTIGGPLSTDKAMASMPENVQNDYSILPPTAQRGLKRAANMKMS